MTPTLEEITAALVEARKAAVPSRESAARESGISYSSIQKYEGKRDDAEDPTWITPIQYLAFLASKNEDARTEIMGLLGIPTEAGITDPELGSYFNSLAAAWPDLTMRERIRGAMAALGLKPGERNAAPARASRPGS